MRLDSSQVSLAMKAMESMQLNRGGESLVKEEALAAFTPAEIVSAQMLLLPKDAVEILARNRVWLTSVGCDKLDEMASALPKPVSTPTLHREKARDLSRIPEMPDDLGMEAFEMPSIRASDPKTDRVATELCKIMATKNAPKPADLLIDVQNKLVTGESSLQTRVAFTSGVSGIRPDLIDVGTGANKNRPAEERFLASLKYEAPKGLSVVARSLAAEVGLDAAGDGLARATTKEVLTKVVLQSPAIPLALQKGLVSGIKLLPAKSDAFTTTAHVDAVKRVASKAFSGVDVPKLGDAAYDHVLQKDSTLKAKPLDASNAGATANAVIESMVALGHDKIFGEALTSTAFKAYLTKRIGGAGVTGNELYIPIGNALKELQSMTTQDIERVLQPHAEALDASKRVSKLLELFHGSDYAKEIARQLGPLYGGFAASLDSKLSALFVENPLGSGSPGPGEVDAALKQLVETQSLRAHLPLFLTKEAELVGEQFHILHERALKLKGGTKEALEPLVIAAAQLHSDIYDKHLFQDGNTRTARCVMLALLHTAGISVQIPETYKETMNLHNDPKGLAAYIMKQMKAQ